MLAKDIMVKNVVSVPLSALLPQVAEVMHQSGVSGVPVVNDDGIVQGLITERELFSGDYQLHYPTYIRLLGHTDFVLGGNKTLPYEAGRVMRITAGEVMNKQMFFAPEDLELSKVAEGILATGQPMAPVVDSGNQLLGVISKGDLVRFFSGSPATPKTASKPRYVDKEFDYVQKDLSSRFAFVAKARANVWLTTATILFIVGFLAGIVYVVNPQIFHFGSNGVNIEAPPQ
jgi:CBS domain-containing protein